MRWLIALVIETSAIYAAPKPGEPIEKGDIRTKSGFYSVVFYYAPKPLGDPLQTARALAKEMMPDTPFHENPNSKAKPPFIGYEEEQAPLKRFPVPQTSYFKFAGRGLSEDDIAAFQKTTVATRLVLAVPSDNVWNAAHTFTELTHRYAEKTGAFIWDSATRECFSRSAWKKTRLDDWKRGEIPKISSQTAIHLYRADETSGYFRAITLGMEKFALPDVVIERLVASNNRPAGNLINLVCQILAENPKVTDAAKQEFRIDALKSVREREDTKSTLLDGAKGTAVLALLAGTRDEGDPENRLIELGFANGAGNSEDERRESILDGLWGTKDSIIGVKHSEEILAASKRARTKLETMRAAFLEELPPGERLLVKAPFKRDDEGNEWMWVEVLKWPDAKKLEGVLQNQPFHIKNLKSGARVTVNFDELFDYIHYRADGSMDGNETGRLMEKQQGPTKTSK